VAGVGDQGSLGVVTVGPLAPLSVEVALPATGPMGMTNNWGEEISAERVSHRATRSTATGRVVVSVTLFAASGGYNRSWYDSRYFVADGLTSGLPPTWVPPAPEWFWGVVADMASIDGPPTTGGDLRG
jgi:hypothetical protein